MNDAIINIPVFEVISGSLVWNSGDLRDLSLAVNESEFFSASSTTYVDGTYVFNGFTDEKVDPAQVNYVEISPGVLAVAWAFDIWKEQPDGRWNSDYDLFFRVVDTNTGAFLTPEHRITDTLNSEDFANIAADDLGGFKIIWESGEGIYQTITVIPDRELGAGFEVIEVFLGWNKS